MYKVIGVSVLMVLASEGLARHCAELEPGQPQNCRRWSTDGFRTNLATGAVFLQANFGAHICHVRNPEQLELLKRITRLPVEEPVNWPIKNGCVYPTGQYTTKESPYDIYLLMQSRTGVLQYCHVPDPQQVSLMASIAPRYSLPNTTQSQIFEYRQDIGVCPQSFGREVMINGYPYPD